LIPGKSCIFLVNAELEFRWLEDFIFLWNF
jgi:hypothetical protein